MLVRAFVILLCVCVASPYIQQDSEFAAITVYRNPDFFGHGFQPNNFPDDDYKYPGEPKKPNPKPSTSFVGGFDDSPEFHHGPRDVFHDPGNTPKKGRGPYGHPRFLFPLQSFDDSDYLERSKPLFDEDNSNLEEEDDANLAEEEDDESARQDDEESSNQEEEYNDNSNLEEDEEADGSTGHYEDVDTFEESRPNFKQHTFYEDEVGDIVDPKPGTREYFKFHKAQTAGEAADLTNHKTLPHKSQSIRPGGSRLVFKIVPKKFKPAFVLSYKRRPHKNKFLIKYKPIFGRRHSREIADDSVYQLNSEFDMDYESVLKARAM